MKIIDWNNLEEQGFKRTKNGNWRKNGKGNTYYKKVCKVCGEYFLGDKNNKCCDLSCSSKKENLSKETLKRRSESMKGDKHPMWGKHRTEETKRKISEAKKGTKLSEEHKKKLSEITGKYHKGEKCNWWKGGYRLKNIPTYDTYAPQLEWCEEVRRNKEDRNILEVKCFKCGKWYIPKLSSVYNRVKAINDKINGESHLYCSKGCKNSCSIYGKKTNELMRQDAIRAGRLSWLELDREVQPELRKMVLERDGYQCVKCGSVGPLHCHHIYPVAIEPLLSADVDNCVTYCIDCHKEAHKKDGCRYGELANLC
jgi:hypothetical protein